MKVEELIKYRDQFNDIVLKHQKKTKKWVIIYIICYILGVLSILIPAGIVGDNNGQEKPLYFDIFMIIGICLIIVAVLATSIYIYHFVIINKNKKYKDILSHELTSLVMKHQDISEKVFPFISKVNN